MELTGKAASKGQYIGKARVCRTVADSYELEPGEVMVCTMTTPEWTMAFGKVGGIITEVGGLLCHAAIVAREHKIPTVLAIAKATSIIKTGDVVELDGTTGKVLVKQA